MSDDEKQPELDDLDNYFVAHLFLPDPESRSGWTKLGVERREPPRPKNTRRTGLR